MFSNKKILALTAIIIIVAPVFLNFALFIKEKSVQHSMKEKLENASLQCIIAKEGNYRWVKFNKEIEIDGRLFDVKHFSKKDGQTYFTGLYDYQEDLVKKKMRDLVNKDNKNNLPQQQLLKFLFNPAININDQFVFDRSVLFTKNEYGIFEEEIVFRPFQCFTPPPNS